MGLTCFVAYSVFMLMVAEKVPATSETVPIISIMSFFNFKYILMINKRNLVKKMFNLDLLLSKNDMLYEKIRISEIIVVKVLKSIENFEFLKN